MQILLRYAKVARFSFTDASNATRCLQSGITEPTNGRVLSAACRVALV